MKLKQIIKDITPLNIKGDLNIDIYGLEYDSRQIKQDSLFICIEGFKDDGHKYIGEAVKRGARAVIIEKEIDNYRSDVTYIRVRNSRIAMARVAAVFFSYPLKQISLIGVTGTNGKTTTTYLVKAILEEAGYKTGLIGTIRNIIGDKYLPSTRTTPESLDLYRLFHRMVEEDVNYAVMEVSSHALELNRVLEMDFRVGVFTNISQDHLDFHESIEEYLEAKKRLFTQVINDGYSVINRDDRFWKQVGNASCGKVITYGIDNSADLQAIDINLSPGSVSFKVINNINIEIKLNLSGRFNVYNSLAAIGTALSLDIPPEIIKTGLESMEGVAGRFELIREGQNFTVVVDYAHTPDGMENVLKTAAELKPENIISVFGCGGDRDRGKRPRMGKIAVEYSNYSILTSDNPRSENPDDIIAEIEQGITEKYSDKYEIMPDRRDAIFNAVNRARENDIIIIFGKGHETYQVFSDKTVHFDDRKVARQAIQKRLANKS